MNKKTKTTTTKTSSTSILCRVKFVYIPNKKTNIDRSSASILADRQDFGKWMIYKIEGSHSECLGNVNGGHTHEELEFIADSVCNRIESFEYDVKRKK